MLVQVRDHLQTECAPEIGQGYISADRFQLDLSVEGKRRAVRHEAGEGIAVEVITMSRVGGPVGIGVMRRHDPDAATWSGDAMQFGDEGHHIGHMFDHMAADDLIEFVVAKRKGKDTEVMDDIGIAARIGIEGDGAGKLILAAADVESFQF